MKKLLVLAGLVLGLATVNARASTRRGTALANRIAGANDRWAVSSVG